MKFPKIIISAALSVLIIFLCSCADLGVGEDEDSFKDYFSKVIMLSHEGRTERSVGAFNKDTTLENCNEIDKVVDFGRYCYIAFQVSSSYKELSVDEFAFFACTESENVTLELEFYVTDTLPTKIESDGESVYFPESAENDNSVYTPETDPDTGQVIERENGEKTDSDVFGEDKRYHTDSFRVSPEWSSTLLEFDSPQTVLAGEYIVVRIKNNCETDAQESTKAAFTFNHLMFHFTSVSES